METAPATRRDPILKALNTIQSSFSETHPKTFAHITVFSWYINVLHTSGYLCNHRIPILNVWVNLDRKSI